MASPDPPTLDFAHLSARDPGQMTREQQLVFWTGWLGTVFDAFKEQHNLMENEFEVMVHPGCYPGSSSQWFCKIVLVWEGGQFEVPDVRCKAHAFPTKEDAIIDNCKLLLNNGDAFMESLHEEVPTKEITELQKKLQRYRRRKGNINLIGVQQFRDADGAVRTVVKRLSHELHSPRERCLYPLDQCLACKNKVDVRRFFAHEQVDGQGSDSVEKVKSRHDNAASFGHVE